MSLIVMLTALALAAPADEQAAETKSSTLVFQGARLYDGSGSSPIEPATLVVRDGKIMAAGKSADIEKTLPTSIEVIDCQGMTITPGLISDHSHVGVVEGVQLGGANYTRENVRRQLRQYAAYGVTTVTALGMNRPLFDELRAEAHAGVSPGADLFGAGQGIGVPGGFPPLAAVQAADDQLYRPSNEEEARRIVRLMAERKLDLVKIWFDGNRGAAPKMSREVFSAVLDEAHRCKLRVAAHIYELADAKEIVAAGVDVVAHGVRDQEVDAEFIQLMKDRGVWYIPTMQLDEATFAYAERPSWTQTPFFTNAASPELRQRFDDEAWQKKTLADPATEKARRAIHLGGKNLKTLFDAGVKVGFGTDSGAHPNRIPGFAEHRELALYVEAGLTPEQALQIATSQAAKLLALEDRGVLAAGKRADFLVLKTDEAGLLASLAKIQSVWRAGRQESGPVSDFRP